MIEALAEDLDVRLGSVVSEISYPPSPSANKPADSASVKTVAGETLSCDAVLLTVPLGCLKARDVRFSPPLPDWKQEVIQRLGYGNLNKVVMQFPTCFWDTSVDYFGAAVEDAHDRGNCFMFWNLHVRGMSSSFRIVSWQTSGLPVKGQLHRGFTLSSFVGWSTSHSLQARQNRARGVQARLLVQGTG